jgi:hypothetical protein
MNLDAIITQGNKLNSDIERISAWKLNKVTNLTNWANTTNTTTARNWAKKQINGAVTWADGQITAKQAELDNLRELYKLVNSANSDKVVTQAQTKPFRPTKAKSPKLAPTVDFYDTCKTGF